MAESDRNMPVRMHSARLDELFRIRWFIFRMAWISKTPHPKRGMVERRNFLKYLAGIATLGATQMLFFKSGEGMEGMQPQIDHLVIAARNLEEGSEYLFGALGLRPQEGGEHAAQGTHNRVLRLGEDCYLEVIAINPHALKPSHPRWFELDSEAMQERLRRKPLLLTWAVRTDRIEQLADRSIAPLGSVTAMSRDNLRWLLTITEGGRLPGGGILPFLIQWDKTVHPASRMMDAGCSLVSLRGFHPQTDEILAALRSLGADQLISLEPIPSHETPRLAALIQTPSGVKTLS